MLRAREIEFFCDGNEIAKMTKLHVILLKYRIHPCIIIELPLCAATLTERAAFYVTVALGQEFKMSSIEKAVSHYRRRSGFGRAFAQAALEKGHRVVGTVRDEEAAALFESLAPGRAMAVRLDVTDIEAIEPAVAGIERTIGPVDVLINNAGYGHEGTLRNRRSRRCAGNSRSMSSAPSE